MKLFLPFAILASSITSANALLDATVAQTFILPMQESLLLSDAFKVINSNAGTAQTNPTIAAGLVSTMFSMTISTDGTVIFYDHWEDGYEYDLSNPTQKTTQIWGDGNATNGCAPFVTSCTNAADVLKAGTAIVINRNITTVNRKTTDIFFDGGDQVGANFPIALVRGGFPVYPGSLLAGAVEVFSMDQWGTSFEAPVGTDVSYQTSPFEMSKLFIMSSFDGTNVTYQTGSLPNTFKTVTLSKGQSIAISIKQSWTVTGTSPLQVTLVTGDIGSTYEMRWYALLPTSSWAKNYLSPVGDSVGKTKVIMYNPNAYTISVSYDYFNDKGVLTTVTNSISSKKNGLTNTIPTGSAVKVYSNDIFLALSWTDSETTDGNGVTTNGQAYDWGYPVMPFNMLTPQVIIGLGYGCTYNQCNPSTKKIMSTVWVSPVADADIYVDYTNDGVVDKTITLSYLKSAIITDTADQDMSGALIFATAKGTGTAGPPVKIAAAWGQNAQFVTLTPDDQSRSLDLGTCVLPFPTIRVSKTVVLAQDKDHDGMISPGDIVTYDIRITNVGQVDIAAGQILIVDDGLDSQLTYIPGTTYYNTAGGASVHIDDDTSGKTLFPIDEAGIKNIGKLGKRGGQHEIVFNCTVANRPNIVRDTLVNTGYAQLVNDSPQPFSVVVPLNLPAIVPTKPPTKPPTKKPTTAPTKAPTKPPTHKPTPLPTKRPTKPPTKPPTTAPTKAPTKKPSLAPTKRPTSAPTVDDHCPVPNTRTYLEPDNHPTHVEHHEAAPGFVLPKQKTTGTKP